MLVLGPIGFTAPWVLLGLLSLPILWLILRAVPPAPIRKRFPGVALLFGLQDEEVETDRTPWWLLLLRMLAVTALILAFAGPVLNPRVESRGTGPLVILLDGGWASGQDWSLRMGQVETALDEAQADNRPVAIALATDLPQGGAEFLSPDAWRARLAGLAPAAYMPDMTALAAFVSDQEDDFDTLWLSDGLERSGRADVLAAMEAKGDVRVFENPRPIYALGAATLSEDGVTVPVLRRVGAGGDEITVVAHGPDPAGVPRVLARQTVVFDANEAQADVAFDLPPELRNRVDRFEIEGYRSAAAVRLSDDSLARREVGLVRSSESREGLALLSQLHYIQAALTGKADLIEADLADLADANPDVIVLADVAQLSGGESASLLDWVSDGGLLLRFAGPRLAASNVARDAEDPLLPVRLRAGGRTIGGAMSWGEPKTLRPFSETSPFYGLPIPEDVTVAAQVMAQPDPDLADRVIATLADGTPLVSRKAIGQGQVVLFHVTANAEWSTLPLSGLFVSMLERLTQISMSETPSEEDLAGQSLQPLRLLDGFGVLSDAAQDAPVDGADFAAAIPSAETLPGLYQGRDAVYALNAYTGESLAPQVWPAGTTIIGAQVQEERPLKPELLMAALLLLGLDIFASLVLSGRLRGASGVGAAVLMATFILPQDLRAQDDDFALAASEDIALAYVLTGDANVDRISEAGLRGLSDVLYARTSVEPSDPIGVDPNVDELGFFPLLYWPVTAGQAAPSAEGYTRLNAYLRTGGMILFDTRDADVAGYGAATPTGAALQNLAAPLDIPPLEPIPEDHVLTRAFYLLQDFPGRFSGAPIWVEAAPEDAEQVEGMPFRNLNDNVSPVVVGGNDWASAWAVDTDGRALRPVGRGFNGQAQREMAYRFGVNLVMYVLTGNYKSDQVHVPALLDRLGQ